MSDRRPTRVDALEIHTVADGYVVYQTEAERVHYLNRTASLVLELCDGKSDAPGLASVLQDVFDLSDPPLDEVAEILDRFYAEGLVQ